MWHQDVQQMLDLPVQCVHDSAECGRTHRAWMLAEPHAERAYLALAMGRPVMMTTAAFPHDSDVMSIPAVAFIVLKNLFYAHVFMFVFAALELQQQPHSTVNIFFNFKSKFALARGALVTHLHLKAYDTFTAALCFSRQPCSNPTLCTTLSPFPVSRSPSYQKLSHKKAPKMH